MNRKLHFVLVAPLVFCLLTSLQIASAVEEGEGKTITVPTTPAFKIKLPPGWKHSDGPVTLDSIITSAALDVVMQFGSLGEMDADGAKKKSSSEAQIFLVGSGDDRNAPAPAPATMQIGGKPGFAISANYTTNGKAKQLRYYAFSLDGKSYDYITVQGPQDKLGNVDAMIKSITAAE